MIRPLAFSIAMILLILAPRAEAQTPTRVAQEAHMDQNIGATVPGDLSFIDESGRTVRLAELIDKQPTILVLAYFSCPDLCPLNLRHLVEGLNGVALDAGRDFQVVVVSFDPRDDPAAARSAKLQYVRAYRRQHGDPPGFGWHFLTGSRDAIEKLTSTVGFHYLFDAPSQRFAHPAGAIVLTSGGSISHYFFGIDYAPATLESALRDASAGHSSWTRDPQQQYCFAYNPLANPRTRIVTRILQFAGGAWVALLLGYIGFHISPRRRSEGER